MIATFGYVLVRNNFSLTETSIDDFIIDVFNIIARLQAHCKH